MNGLLPSPTLTFTIPSLHDGTVLDCRVYHPASLAASAKAPPWHRHAAVVAHPYGPLGGSYDDPIVDVVAGTLLRLGFLVATFNFRGAGGSAGRTSWTAKAEKADYASVAAFVYYYAHFLDPSAASSTSPVSPASPTSSPLATLPDRPPPTPILLMAGYSYGATITSLLPPLPHILAPLSTPTAGSPAAEIRLRAEHLASAQNTLLVDARRAARGKSHRQSLGVRVGGEEEVGLHGRASHEASSPRRSMSLDAEEKIRRGVAELMARARNGRVGKNGTKNEVKDGEPAHEPEQDHLPAVHGLPEVQPAYLLVSPPVGMVTSLATMSFGGLPFLRKSKKASADEAAMKEGGGAEGDEGEAEWKLSAHPTLVVYGDSDGFLSNKRVREWASRLGGTPESRFRAHEVSTAGHFWAEGRTVYVLRDAVGAFGTGLLRGHGRVDEEA